MADWCYGMMLPCSKRQCVTYVNNESHEIKQPEIDKICMKSFFVSVPFIKTSSHGVALEWPNLSASSHRSSHGSNLSGPCL